jgi:hypothetical protein
MQNHLLDAEAYPHILHPGSRQLFAHWETLRAERAYPRREEFTFAPVKDLMPDMVLIEKDYLRNGYAFLLAGSRVCELLGKNLTASNALEGWDAFEKTILASHFELALEEYQPVLIRMRLTTDTGFVVAAELIALPIQTRDSANVQLIGGLFPFRDIKNSGHKAIKSRQLISARSIWTEHEDSGRRGEAEALQTQPATERRGKPLLRVVSGGRAIN